MNREYPRGFVPESAEPPASDEEITREWQRPEESPLSVFERLDLENLVTAKLQEYPALRVHGAEPALRDIITRQLLERRALLTERNRAERAVRHATYERQQAKIQRWTKSILKGGALLVAGEVAVIEAYRVESMDVRAVAPLAGSEEGAEAKAEQRDYGTTDLREMDPQATPERMRRMREALPSGWTRDVRNISYVNEKGFQIDEMAPGNFAAAQAVDAENDPEGRTDIIYYLGSKELDREFRFGETYVHEVLHGNDWNDDGDLTDSQKAYMKGLISARVRAPNRFDSAYIKGIDPKKTDKLELEYWSVIGEAYWRHEDLSSSGLAQEDVDILNWHVSVTNPGFDRDKAVREFRGVLREMSQEERLPGLCKTLEAMDVEKEDLDALQSHVERRRINWAVPPSTDAALRRVIVGKVAEWAVNPTRRAFVSAMMDTISQREVLASAVLEIGKVDPAKWASLTAEFARAAKYASVFDRDPDLGEDAEKLAAEVEGFISVNDLLIGTKAMDRQFIDGTDMHEMEAMAMEKSGAKGQWAMKAFKWWDDSPLNASAL